ncbi:MAG: ferritin-like protein [Rhodopila sp.]
MQDQKITTIKMLKHYLHVAMQLEHATVPPYLTALYSIKPDSIKPDSTQPGGNLEAVQVLRVVAVEEMLHLALAANLLNAIDGKPKLSDSGFVPSYPAYLPDGERDFEVHLQAFSQDAVATFLKIERPSMAPKPEMRLMARSDRRAQSFLAASLNEPELYYYSIGEFYRAIEQGLIHLEQSAQASGKTIFIGDPAKQVTADHYYSGGGRLFPVTNLETGRYAINAIIAQGEGEDRGIFGPDGELAHFYRFNQLKHGRYYQKSDDPGPKGGPVPVPTGPELKVDWTAVYPIKTDAKLADYEPGSETYAAAVAFNTAYAAFLGLIEQAFNGQPDRLNEAVPMMFGIRNKVNQLMRNPLNDGSVYNAAPTFEIGATGATP